MTEIHVEKATQHDWDAARPKANYKRTPNPWDAHKEALEQGEMLRIHYTDDVERSKIARGLGRTAAYWDPPMKLDFRYNDEKHLIVVRKSDEPYVRKSKPFRQPAPGERRRGRPPKDTLPTPQA